MLHYLLKLRYLAVIVTVFLLLDAIAAIGYGIYKSIESYQHIFSKDPEAKPYLGILKAIDIFLFGLVFLIFGLGLSRIFLYYRRPDERLPRWLNVNNLSELVVVLWETIITAFIIYFATLVAQLQDTQFNWTLLIMPASILMLTVCLVIFKKYVADTERSPTSE